MFSVETIASVQRLIAGLIAYLIAAGLVGGFQAWVTKKMGDDGPEELGHLTINPFAHVDIIGIMCLTFLGIGFLPPIPINPHHMPYRHRTLRYATALFSGFFMSIALALSWLLVWSLLGKISTYSGESIASFLSFETGSLLTAGALMVYMLFITSVFFAILYLVYGGFVLFAYCISDKIDDEDRNLVGILFIVVPIALVFLYGNYLNNYIIIKLMNLF